MGEESPKNAIEQGSSMLTSAVIHTYGNSDIWEYISSEGSDFRVEGESVGRSGGSDSHLHR